MGILENDTDEDWYLVHLLAGENVLSINGSTGSAMTFEVFNTDLIQLGDDINFVKDINFSNGEHSRIT